MEELTVKREVPGKIEGLRNATMLLIATTRELPFVKEKRNEIVKSTLARIDRELAATGNITELDFKAGCLNGIIYEKEESGQITQIQAKQLRNMLFAKYEIMRSLEA